MISYYLNLELGGEVVGLGLGCELGSWTVGYRGW